MVFVIAYISTRQWELHNIILDLSRRSAKQTFVKQSSNYENTLEFNTETDCACGEMQMHNAFRPAHWKLSWTLKKLGSSFNSEV